MDLFADLVGEDSPSNLVYSVEYLLSQTDEEGRPAPYFCDALDLIDAAEARNGLHAVETNADPEVVGQENGAGSRPVANRDRGN